MGVRNVLIEGVSGAGKTTVAEELERRGYHVIHGDRSFAYYGDPETGAALDWPDMDDGAAKIAWGYAHWIWPVDRVNALVADATHALTIFCGGCRNSQHFIHRFDAVFVLDVDRDTLTRRLAGRGDDEFGGTPLERDLVLAIRDTGDGLPHDAIRIDATRPVTEVVDTILMRCRT